MAATAPILALKHFDSFYAKVLGRNWPSARLGLLSPKKHCLIANSFLGPEEQRIERLKDDGAIELSRYYKKHLYSYHESIRQPVKQTVEVTTTIPDTASELNGGLSSAEDLMQMFSDRRMDDDEKYFINRASTQLSLNDFVPATEFISKEHTQSDLAYYEGYDPDLKLDVEHIEEPPLEFSSELKIFTFPRGSWSRFDEPQIRGSADLSTHYLLDGGSVLPVLALDVQFDDFCADYCAAPGGKSLALLMTLRPKQLLCNDWSSSRLGRMYTMMRQYVPDVNYIRETLRLLNKDARMLAQADCYDKILVDVPCSNDRVSVDNLENNIFKRSRTDERLLLPSIQCDILTAALKSVRPKGAVVYSTCTMSPLENDSVVQKALARLQTEGHHARFAVVSLKEAFRPLRGIYKFHTKFDYGQLVIPSITSNFGPMYISKIKRLT